MIDINIFYNDLKNFVDKNYYPVFYQLAYSDVENEMDNVEASFSSKLFQFIKDKGISETDCYKRANLDRRLFSKIRSNIKYHPSKETILCLSVAMELSKGEAENLLNSAGYCLSTSSRRDLAIAYILSHKVYDMYEINEVLCMLGEEPLGVK